MISLNLLGPYPFGYYPTFIDLLFFSLGSFAVIFILSLYYNRIPKSNSSKDKLKTPIYQTKDILLQSNSFDASFIIAEKTTSIWTKVILFILIAFVVIIPVDQLFSVVNSFY